MFGACEKSSPKVTFDEVTKKWSYGSASSSHSSASSSGQKSFAQSGSRMSRDSYEDPKAKLNAWCKPLDGCQSRTRQLQEKFWPETPDARLSPHYCSSSQDDRSSLGKNDKFQTGSQQYSGLSTAAHHRGASYRGMSDVRKELLVDKETITSRPLTSFTQSNLHRRPARSDNVYATEVSSERPLLYSQSSLIEDRELLSGNWLPYVGTSPAVSNDNRPVNDLTSPVDGRFTCSETQLTDHCDRPSTTKCERRPSAHRGGGRKRSHSLEDPNSSQPQSLSCLSEQTSNFPYLVMDRPVPVRDSCETIERAACQTPPTSDVGQHRLEGEQSCDVGQPDSSDKHGSSYRDSCNDGNRRWMGEQSSCTFDNPNKWQSGLTGEHHRSSTRESRNILQSEESGKQSCSARDFCSDEKRRWMGEQSSCTYDNPNSWQRGLTGEHQSSSAGESGKQRSSTRDSRYDGERRWMDELDSHDFERRELPGEQSSSTFESCRPPSIGLSASSSDHSSSTRIAGKRGVTGEQRSSAFESCYIGQLGSSGEYRRSAHDSRSDVRHRWIGEQSSCNLDSCNFEQRRLTGRQGSSAIEPCNIGQAGLSGVYSGSSHDSHIVGKHSRQSSSTLDSPINWQQESACKQRSSALKFRHIELGQLILTGKQSSSTLEFCDVGPRVLSNESSCAAPDHLKTWKSRSTDEQGCSALEPHNIGQHQLLGKHGSCTPDAYGTKQCNLTGEMQQSRKVTHNEGKMASGVPPFSMDPFHTSNNDTPNESSSVESPIVSGVDTQSVPPKMLERSVKQTVINDQQKSSLTSSKWLAFINGSLNENCVDKTIGKLSASL